MNNPSDFRAALSAIFDQSPLTIGGQAVEPNIVAEAIEEVVAVMVRAYMQDGQPATACEHIVGRFFVSMLEKQE